MLPHSTGELLRFTPEHYTSPEKPVYFFRPPMFLKKAQRTRMMQEQGIELPGTARLAAALREGVKEVLPTEEAAAAALRLVDMFEEAGSSSRMEESTRAAFVEIEMAVYRHSRKYSGLVAKVNEALAVLPFFSLQLTLQKAEGIAANLQFDSNGLLTEASLASLPQADVAACGLFALRLFSVSEEQEKN